MEKKVKDFAGSLAQLEALVSEMEIGDLPLESLMKHFEAGKKLLVACRRDLDAVTKRIEKVTATEVVELEVPSES